MALAGSSVNSPAELRHGEYCITARTLGHGQLYYMYYVPIMHLFKRFPFALIIQTSNISKIIIPNDFVHNAQQIALDCVLEFNRFAETRTALGGSLVCLSYFRSGLVKFKSFEK